jgi:hypothetical protein
MKRYDNSAWQRHVEALKQWRFAPDNHLSFYALKIWLHVTKPFIQWQLPVKG